MRVRGCSANVPENLPRRQGECQNAGSAFQSHDFLFRTAMPARLEQFPCPETLQPRCRLLLESYRRLTGRVLAPFRPETDDPCQVLWQANRVIVAHGTEADPVFFFGNRLALSLFEMDFAAFTRLPSRYSAEPLRREERARLLERVTRDGYIDDYAGVRISSQGKRFRIEQATVWNLTDSAGRLHGQAATFDHWHALDE